MDDRRREAVGIEQVDQVVKFLDAARGIFYRRTEDVASPHARALISRGTNRNRDVRQARLHEDVAEELAVGLAYILAVRDRENVLVQREMETSVSGLGSLEC